MSKPAKTATNMIKKKKSLFKDFCIEWDPAIERRFATEMDCRPNSDPEIILDQICHPYIKRGLGC